MQNTPAALSAEARPQSAAVSCRNTAGGSRSPWRKKRWTRFPPKPIKKSSPSRYPNPQIAGSW